MTLESLAVSLEQELNESSDKEVEATEEDE